MSVHNRLRWRCRRGLLELDLTLGRFIDSRYDRLTATEKRIFHALLTETDSDLWSWIQGADAPRVYRPVLCHLMTDAPPPPETTDTCCHD